ncbi:von Willebrand factor type A domain protein [Roseimaritima multifibrata]|uniref:von Willebrand factor type A domain protein n=1 Tax=Roseimaritima multifibrata TaxID=1930274 RepID=A0A517MEP3_9BACT|nr:VWA domain-containing protein [Roseimaritima multifibrata]QDS93365.1 von Willebrand factor type A domain protein [Roseimaritima multifibrata]
MIGSLLLPNLLAQADVVSSDRQEIVYTLERAAWLDGWWAWALTFVVIAVLFGLMIRLYRRDTEELPRLVRMSLIFLRICTLAGLVFFFFGLTRRTQQSSVRQSEIAVLVDTSQSMSLPADNEIGSISRSELAAQIMSDSSWLDEFAADQRVTIYGFDQGDEPRELEVRAAETDTPVDAEAAEVLPVASSRVAVIGLLTICAALILCAASLFLGATGRVSSLGQPLFWGVITIVTGICLLSGAWTIHADRSLNSLLGFADTEAPDENEPASEPSPDQRPTDGDEENKPEERRVQDWNEALLAAGQTTHLGDAMRSVLTRHDPATLAAIIVLTDGQTNGGTPAASAAGIAARNGVSVYPLGLGSSLAPVNVRIVDLDAPRRVYPGDKFALSAVLQASGSEPVTVQVQLLDGADGDAVPSEVVDSKEVTLSVDGTLTGVPFEMDSETIGRRRLAIRVVPPEGDQNSEDDIRDARYEVVARKLRVLAVAGGPMREYRFVRNLLFRDKSTQLDVLLQTGQPGMSQDADAQLSEFPSTPEEMFQYDALIAFDVDWLQLDAAQLDLLDRWLSEQAGGMILVSGPVYMPQWTTKRTDPRVSKLAGFFPVNLTTSNPLLRGGRAGGEIQWPLKMTPEALRTEFLWVTDDPQTSFEAWEESGGVYDYVGVKDAKAGAKVYAYFSDPTTAISDQYPVYMASQFYGAGRVFFLGSGEMWRLRGVSDAYFDNFYTKLLRWVSEGRLMRDSNRGLLLVDRPRAMVGESINVRAVLTNEQFEPLDVPSVNVDILAPGGQIGQMQLTPLPGEPRAGTYGGRMLVREAGNYELRLTLGDSLKEDVLQQTIQVRLPTLELERPRRNDDDLMTVAKLTGGIYLPIGEPSSDSANVAPTAALATLTGTIEPQPQTSVLPGAPDRDFNRRLNASLMWLLATCLTFEWVVRRLHRLA